MTENSENKKRVYGFTTWAYTWYFDAESERMPEFYNGKGAEYKEYHDKLMSWKEEDGAEKLRLYHSDYLFRMFSKTENNIKFTIGQVERCPTTYRLHFQGVLVFRKQVSKKFFKDSIPMPTVHFEPCHHDLPTNIKYCSKSQTKVADFNCYGIPPPGQGSRSDLVAVYEMALQQATAKEMLKELGHTGMRHVHLFQKTVAVLQDDDDEDKKILRRRAERSKALKESLYDEGFKVGGAYEEDD